MIDLGYYNGKTFSVVLNTNIISIDGFLNKFEIFSISFFY